MPWLDAAWHPAGWVEGLVPFDAADRGLLLGDGVFDTSLVLGGRMVWRDAHLARIAAHARAIGIGIDAARLAAAVDGTLKAVREPRGALRLTVTRGAGRRGVAPSAAAHPTLLATLAPLATAALFAPVALHPSAIPRNERSPLSRVKSLCYGDVVLATGTACAEGCDDVLVLNGAGRIACTGVGNVFAVFGAELATPPLHDGVLDGVTRSALLAAAREGGFEPVERSLDPADLHAADAVVCTNSLRLVAPVTAIGARVLAVGRAVSALVDLISRAVVRDVAVDPRSLVDA